MPFNRFKIQQMMIARGLKIANNYMHNKKIQKCVTTTYDV